MNIDDPTWSACNVGDFATRKDGTIPNHLQDHDDRLGKDYIVKIECVNERIETPQKSRGT